MSCVALGRDLLIQDKQKKQVWGENQPQGIFAGSITLAMLLPFLDIAPTLNNDDDGWEIRAATGWLLCSIYIICRIYILVKTKLAFGICSPGQRMRNG